MALYESNNVTEDQINEVAIEVHKYLPSKCKFCPRSFERGEYIVFGTIKNVQMKWIGADIEKAEPEGFGEEHCVEVISAHKECAVGNKEKFRGVTSPRNIK